MHLNWQKFSGDSELLSFPPQFFFLVKNVKIAFLQKKKVLNIFYRIEVQAITNLSSRLGKTLNICIFSKGRFSKGRLSIQI